LRDKKGDHNDTGGKREDVDREAREGTTQISQNKYVVKEDKNSSVTEKKEERTSEIRYLLEPWGGGKNGVERRGHVSKQEKGTTPSSFIYNGRELSEIRKKGSKRVEVQKREKRSRDRRANRLKCLRGEKSRADLGRLKATRGLRN